MWTRLKLDLWLKAIILLFPLSSLTMPLDLPDAASENKTTIQVEYPPSPYISYRERRADWGWTASLRYENFQPSSFSSTVNNETSTYTDLFGDSTIQLLGPRIGVKYNAPFGSLALEGSYETGSVTGTNSGDYVSMDVTKLGLHLGLFLDALWPEPYVVPYIQGSLSQYNFQLQNTDSPDFSDSGSSGMIMGYTLGALIQLNWLDSQGAREGLVNTGLSNAFLDLFVTQNMSPDSGTDFSSDLNWGVGVKLEF